MAGFDGAISLFQLVDHVRPAGISDHSGIVAAGLAAAARFGLVHEARFQRRIALAVWTPAILLARAGGHGARRLSRSLSGLAPLYQPIGITTSFFFRWLRIASLFLSTFQLDRWGTLVLFAILAAALIGSRAHYLANVPHAAISKPAVARKNEDAVLVQTIRSSTARPLVLTDASIPMDGAHKTRSHSRF